jgi:hypothetical protein
MKNIITEIEKVVNEYEIRLKNDNIPPPPDLIRMPKKYLIEIAIEKMKEENINLILINIRDNNIMFLYYVSSKYYIIVYNINFNNYKINEYFHS